MTKNLKRKLDQLNKLLSERCRNSKQILTLKQDIAKLAEEDPTLPKKGAEAWCWNSAWIVKGTIERVEWKPALQRFKIGIRAGGLYWKELDQVWSTEREARRWDLQRAIRQAERDVQSAQKKLESLRQELDKL